MNAMIYRNTLVHRFTEPNSWGLRYWALCNGQMLRSDTLAGIRALIKRALGA